MANSLSAVIPQILAQGLLALREFTVMPRLVNRSYGADAREQGDTIDIPIPSAVAAQNVAPGATPPSTADSSPTKVQLALDQWKEAPFYLTDKDLMEAQRGIIPMQASEAIASLAGAVNSHIFSFYKGVYGFTGTPGTAPFGSNHSDATNARKILFNQKSPAQNRRLVLDPDAEGNALNLGIFAKANESGSQAALIEGILGRKLGFDFAMDQSVPTHTHGTLSGTTGDNDALINDASVAVGQKTINLDDTSLTGTIVEGDIFTVAGDTQTYVATNTVTASGNAITGLTFEPGAKVAWADDAVLTIKTDHTVNLAFHRDAFAFASRPLANVGGGLGNQIVQATDPVSGLSLRLEVSREHKRTRWSYDILWGAQLVRRELACRVAG